MHLTITDMLDKAFVSPKMRVPAGLLHNPFLVLSLPMLVPLVLLFI